MVAQQQTLPVQSSSGEVSGCHIGHRNTSGSQWVAKVVQTCFSYTWVFATCCSSFPTFVVTHDTIQQWACIFKSSNHCFVHWDSNNAEEANLQMYTSLLKLIADSNTL